MVARNKAGSVKANSESAKSPDVEASLPVRAKSLVFVSHDSRDADIAEAFANLLADVSAGTLKSFRSSDKKSNSGIEFGAEWYTSIMSQLGDATDVVALLTARSIDRPWILYEAGVAKGKLGTTVLGLALGVPLEKVSAGPFGQFQNCGDDEDSLTKLVMQLLARNPDAAPREEAVRGQVRLFINALSKILEAKPKKQALDGHGEEQNVAKLFEEVKAMVRELPERVDDRARFASRRAANKGVIRFHPQIFEDLISRSTKTGRGERAGVVLLLASFAREDVPWLYELGINVYRALLTNDRATIEEARENLLSTWRVFMEGPWRRGVLSDDEDAHALAGYLPGLIDRATSAFLASMPIRRRVAKMSDFVKSPAPK